jgi:endo-1,4-beta-D-glucanase Y
MNNYKQTIEQTRAVFKKYHKPSEYETVAFEDAEEHWAKRKQVLLARSQALVIAMVGKELSEQWWTSPNKAFEGQTPREQFEANSERVYSYLMRMAEGEW